MISTHNLRLETVQGKDIAPYISALAKLRIQIFREYPYLYDGSEAYEADYLKHYAECPETILVLALDDEQVIGASTGMPLKDYGTDILKVFTDLNVNEIFYFGESVLNKAYRGQGLGHRFFDEREAHAKKLGYTQACFCAVERPEHHPFRPQNYHPHDTFWQKRGYTKQPNRVTHFSWKEVEEAEESQKPLVFWMKVL